MPLPEGFDISNADNIKALQDAGFYTKDQVQNEVQTYNKALEGKRDELLGQVVKYKEKLNSLPVDYDKLAEVSKDPRFGKVIEQGFDSWESGLGNEISQRYEALKTDKMVLEQEYRQFEQRAENEKQELARQLRDTRIENGLHSLVNEFSDKLYQTAVPDLYDMAKRQLELNEKGQIVVLGEDGVPRQTADGPMTARDWLNGMMKEKPHWFKGAAGHGTQMINGKEVDTSGLVGMAKVRAARQRG